MPITKTILKKVRQQAIVKFVGDGSSNVDLVADLKLPDETVSNVSTVQVNINSIIFSSGSTVAPLAVNRSGSNVILLWGNDNWSYSQMMGFVDNQSNNANLVVTIPAPGGTVYLGLTKAAGFTEPNNQALKDYQKI